MIDQALLFLRQRLNAYLNAKAGWKPDESREDRAVFIDGEKLDPISFKLEAVSVLLINVEVENILRVADPYSRVLADGSRQKVFTKHPSRWSRNYHSSPAGLAPEKNLARPTDKTDGSLIPRICSQ